MLTDNVFKVVRVKNKKETTTVFVVLRGRVEKQWFQQSVPTHSGAEKRRPSTLMMWEQIKDSKCQEAELSFQCVGGQNCTQMARTTLARAQVLHLSCF